MGIFTIYIIPERHTLNEESKEVEMKRMVVE